MCPLNPRGAATMRSQSALQDGLPALSGLHPRGHLPGVAALLQPGALEG